MHDWSEYSSIVAYAEEYHFKPFFNQYFITGICAVLAYFFAWRMHKQQIIGGLEKVANMLFVITCVLTAYITFASEIDLIFEIQYQASQFTHTGDYGDSWQDYDHSWKTYETLWMMMYTSVFVSVIGFINLKKFRNQLAAYLIWGFSVLLFLICVWGGFVELGHLMDWAVSYDVYYNISTWNYNFRYVFMISLVLLLAMLYQYRNSDLLLKVRAANTWLFHVFILMILSNELSHLLTVTHLDNYRHYQKVAARMGYTILWGLYSMCLILYGITRKQKLLRVIALSLFGLTLLKLAGDALSMSRGYQLIVFISIGIILLIVSFMYQKFKPLLFGEEPGALTAAEPEVKPDPVP
jgi:low affinity Fe/Cu permease